MRNVLPVFVLNDRPPRRDFAELRGARATNPIRIRKVLENRLVDGGGDPVVLLLGSFGHRLHTLWQRSQEMCGILF